MEVAEERAARLQWQRGFRSWLIKEEAGCTPYMIARLATVATRAGRGGGGLGGSSGCTCLQKAKGRRTCIKSYEKAPFPGMLPHINRSLTIKRVTVQP